MENYKKRFFKVIKKINQMKSVGSNYSIIRMLSDNDDNIECFYVECNSEQFFISMYYNWNDLEPYYKIEKSTQSNYNEIDFTYIFGELEKILKELGIFNIEKL